MKKALLVLAAAACVALAGCTKDDPVDEVEETNPYAFGDEERQILEILSGTYVYEYTDSKRNQYTNYIIFSNYSQWQIVTSSYMTDDDGNPYKMPVVGEFRYILSESDLDRTYFNLPDSSGIIGFRKVTDTTFNPMSFRLLDYVVEEENTLTVTDNTTKTTYKYVRQ